MEHIHAATSVRDALYQISKKSKVHIHAASVAVAKTSAATIVLTLSKKR